MERWHALFTKPRMERRVGRRIAARGIEVYVPLLEYHGRTGRTLDRAFFPRYIFARFDWQNEGVSRVQWTPGLSSIVTFDGKPAVLPDDWVHNLRDTLEEIDGDEFLALKPGEKVRVRSGPFRDIEAIFEKRMNGEDRVAILLEIMGRQTRVIVDGGAVDRIA